MWRFFLTSFRRRTNRKSIVHKSPAGLVSWAIQFDIEQQPDSVKRFTTWRTLGFFSRVRYVPGDIRQQDAPIGRVPPCPDVQGTMKVTACDPCAQHLSRLGVVKGFRRNTEFMGNMSHRWSPSHLGSSNEVLDSRTIRREGREPDVPRPLRVPRLSASILPQLTGNGTENLFMRSAFRIAYRKVQLRKCTLHAPGDCQSAIGKVS
jgi:hypothetical protein